MKSLVVVDDKMTHQPCCFEVFGYDVLIDSALRPWLIEINASPSMARENALDVRVKNAMIADTIRLIDPMPFDRAAVASVLRKRFAGSTHSIKIHTPCQYIHCVITHTTHPVNTHTTHPANIHTTHPVKTHTLPCQHYKLCTLSIHPLTLPSHSTHSIINHSLTLSTYPINVSSPYIFSFADIMKGRFTLMKNDPEWEKDLQSILGTKDTIIFSHPLHTSIYLLNKRHSKHTHH